MEAFSNSRDRELKKLREEVKELRDKVLGLENEFKQLRGKILSAAVPMEITKSDKVDHAAQPNKSQVSQTMPAPTPEKTVHNFYLSTPNSDGSFNNSSANPAYKEGASIYKFQNTKDNHAKFKIDENDASVKLALAYPDKNIDPVCDALNAFDPKARRIFTVEPGIAELAGDNKWKVITKARIRYES